MTNWIKTMLDMLKQKNRVSVTEMYGMSKPTVIIIINDAKIQKDENGEVESIVDLKGA
jgi:hypothetical protein